MMTNAKTYPNFRRQNRNGSTNVAHRFFEIDIIDK